MRRRKGETRGRTHILVLSIIIGSLGSALVCTYLVWTGNALVPLSLLYMIIAPLISALSLLVMIFASKNKREKYVKGYRDREEPEKEESEKRKKLRPSYIAK